MVNDCLMFEDSKDGEGVSAWLRIQRLFMLCEPLFVKLMLCLPPNLKDCFIHSNIYFFLYQGNSGGPWYWGDEDPPIMYPALPQMGPRAQKKLQKTYFFDVVHLWNWFWALPDGLLDPLDRSKNPQKRYRKRYFSALRSQAYPG